MDNDVWVEIQRPGHPYKPLTMQGLYGFYGLEFFDQRMNDKLGKAMEVLARNLEGAIRLLYEEAIRTRDRESGTSLKQRVMRAIRHRVRVMKTVVEMDVFDRALVEKLTSRPQDDVKEDSLFDLMEEGTSSSRYYGYIEYDYALKLAHEVVEISGWGEDEKSAFLNRVSVVFKGREGDGIMVDLHRPLFEEAPWFGTALDHGVVPHPSWEGWHVIDGRNKGQAGAGIASLGVDGWIEMVMTQAQEEAGQWLTS